MKKFNKFWSILVIFTLSFGLLTPARTYAEAPVVKPNEITILHTNDMHGRLDPDANKNIFARLKAYIDDKKPLLVLDGGDTYQGLPVSNISKGADMAQLVNMIGYDALAVGNHEFDFGLDVALGKVDGFGKSLTQPLLSSNTVYKDTGALVFEPSVLVERQGYTIPIIGVTTPETKTKTHPDNIELVKWNDPFESVLEQINREDYKHADFFVIVSHLGIDTETAVAERGDNLAERLSTHADTKDKKIIIIDGHSHSNFNKTYGNVILAQTGDYVKNIGTIEIEFDKWAEGTAVRTASDVFLTDYPFEGTAVKGNADALAIQAHVEATNAKFKEFGSKVVRENNPVDLNGDGDFVRTRQMPIGSLITDSLLDYSNGTTQPADFAVTNGGGIRNSIKKGPVTLGDIIAVLPFGNIYSSIEVSGTDVFKMFERSVSSVTKPDADGIVSQGRDGGFLQISTNVKLTYSLYEVEGQRIRSIEYTDTDGVTHSVKKDGTYRIATNDFLAVGGDKYEMLGGPRVEGPSLDEVFKDFFMKADFNNTLYTSEDAQAALSVSKLHTFFDEPLEEELTHFETLDSKLYTPASFKLYADLVAYGQSLFDQINTLAAPMARLARVEVTQALLDETSTDIKAARAALVLAAVVPVEKEDETTIEKEAEKKPEVKKSELPATGISSFDASGIQYAMVAAGSLLTIIKKKRK